jgi:hypothetical protein
MMMHGLANPKFTVLYYFPVLILLSCCTVGTVSFPGLERPGRGLHCLPHLAPRAELHLCSPHVPSWQVAGRNSPLCLYLCVMRNNFQFCQFRHVEFCINECMLVVVIGCLWYCNCCASLGLITFGFIYVVTAVIMSGSTQGTADQQLHFNVTDVFCCIMATICFGHSGCHLQGDVFENKNTVITKLCLSHYTLWKT